MTLEGSKGINETMGWQGIDTWIQESSGLTVMEKVSLRSRLDTPTRESSTNPSETLLQIIEAKLGKNHPAYAEAQERFLPKSAEDKRITLTPVELSPEERAERIRRALSTLPTGDSPDEDENGRLTI